MANRILDPICGERLGELTCVLPFGHGGIHDFRTSEGRKDDVAKERWDLFPWATAGDVVDVLTYGAEKYAPENWRKVENWRDRYWAATQRHLYAYRMGEKRDPESDLPHLAHAICCLIFLNELED